MFSDTRQHISMMSIEHRRTLPSGIFCIGCGIFFRRKTQEHQQGLFGCFSSGAWGTRSGVWWQRKRRLLTMHAIATSRTSLYEGLESFLVSWSGRLLNFCLFCLTRNWFSICPVLLFFNIVLELFVSFLLASGVCWRVRRYQYLMIVFWVLLFSKGTNGHEFMGPVA
jgi:hypothetical protein